MTVLLAALGDSTSCGEGVGLAVDPALTWPARLARALPGGSLLSLARPGSTTRDLVDQQLDAAVRAEPHLATLLIGLNDVGRGHFDAAGVRADLLHAVAALRRCGATVLLGRLHDPARHLPLPARARTALRARAATVNAAVDEAVRLAGRDGDGGDVHLLDLAALPALAQRRAWAVDRLHPHPATHGLLAAQAARVLADAGLPVADVACEPLPRRDPCLPAELWWTARHGLPWLATHARDVLPAVRYAG